jgi:hypothetical protein
VRRRAACLSAPPHPVQAALSGGVSPPLLRTRTIARCWGWSSGRAAPMAARAYKARHACAARLFTSPPLGRARSHGRFGWQIGAIGLPAPVPRGCAASPIAAILGDDSRTGKLRLAIERSPKPSVERFRADHRLRSDVRLSAGAQAGSEEVCAALVDLHGGAGAGHRRGRRAARARPDSPLSSGGRVSGAALCASEITHSSTPRPPARRQRRARGRQSMPMSASPRPRA